MTTDAWPGAEWATGRAPAHAAACIDEAVDTCLADQARYGVHLGLVVIHRGRLVAERYGATAAADTRLVSWSMAKSVVHAMIGLCVRDGLLRLDQPAPVAEWAGDERSSITIDQLLAMCDGLAFREEYVDREGSDVIDMLFGPGAPDVAGYARARPLAHTPGTVWNYSSGTSNVLAGVVGDAVAPDARSPEERRDRTEAWLRRELLDPLGMASATARFDAAGTFVGSSFLYATARDFARFGLLYLRGGWWRDRRLLPEGWAAHAATAAMAPVPAEEGSYGRHWWLWDASGFPDTFGAHGYEGQYTIVSPARDLVVVRLGKTPAELRPNLLPLLRAIIAAFD